MADHRLDDPLFDYKVYRFGTTKQVFRGPMPDLDGDYVAFIGGSGTFGRFATQPFADLVGQELGLPVVNLGTEGAGPGFFLTDARVLEAASAARVCVVQAMPASSISNRMFSVRSRRNERLHAVSDLLTGMYPEVDFSGMNYVRALLRQLAASDDNRFKLVVNEMRNAWIGRMQTLLATIQTRTVLFWFSQRRPDREGPEPWDHGHYPNFVDRAMIDSVRGTADAYVECVTSAGMPQDLRVGGLPVLFRPSGMPIDENREFPSPEMHEDAAVALVPQVQRLLGR